MLTVQVGENVRANILLFYLGNIIPNVKKLALLKVDTQYS